MRGFGWVVLLVLAACEEPAYVPPALAPDEHERVGDEHLFAGRFAEAVAHFDAYLKAKPESFPHHWRRGIALYYAGEYAKGVAQFEQHRTVNPDDVENAVWHFLCNAKLVGVAKARAALLPVGPDGRIPMPEIYEMFAGRKQPADVQAAADGAIGRYIEQAGLYADLYIGLYHLAHDRFAAAQAAMERAAEHRLYKHYMFEVAKMHARHFAKDQAR